MVLFVADQLAVEPEVSQRELKECVLKLAVARGNFQIAMTLNLVPDSDIDAHGERFGAIFRWSLGLTLMLPTPDIFLQSRLNLFKQSTSAFVDESSEGMRANAACKVVMTDWLENSRKPNILWMSGAPGAGKSDVATRLARRFSESDLHLCAKLAGEGRDPRQVWQTLAYELAGLHAGLKGSIMEVLSAKSDSHYSRTASVEDQFYELVVGVLQNQQCLSVVVILEALDKYLTEDDEHGRALLKTVARWPKLPRTYKLIVTGQDVPPIRNTLAKISHIINLDKL